MSLQLLLKSIERGTLPLSVNSFIKVLLMSNFYEGPSFTSKLIDFNTLSSTKLFGSLCRIDLVLHDIEPV